MNIVEEEDEVSLLKLCLARRNTTVGQHIAYQSSCPPDSPSESRFKALGVTNRLNNRFKIRVFLVPVQVHHHHQPVFSIVTGMCGSFDKGNSNVGFVGIPSRIVGYMLHQIRRMINQLEVL